MIRSNIDKENLVGLTLSEADKKLGYWWVLESCSFCWYRYHKAPNKYIELTANNENVVTSVWYN